jgi:hypothetical protein
LVQSYSYQDQYLTASSLARLRVAQAKPLLPVRRGSKPTAE